MKDVRNDHLKQSLAEQPESPTDEQVRPGPMACDIPEMSGDELFEAFQDFVHDVTQTVRHQFTERAGMDVSYDNLFSYAVSGLLEARNAFDPDDGSAFTTFAYYRIRGAILDGVHRESWGPNRTRRVKSWRAINEQLRESNETAGSAPAPSTLAGSLASIKETVYDVYALTFLYDEHLELRFAHEETPSDATEQNRRRETIEAAINALEERQRQVIIRYHVKGETMTEIADSMGVTKSWISKLNRQAVSELRTKLEETDLL